MGAAEHYNPNTLNQDQVAALLGYESVAYAEKVIVGQGIKPYYGRPGHWFITIDQLNAARGILRWQPSDDEFGDGPL